MDIQFINLKTLLKMVPFSSRHIYNLEQQDLFPKRIKLSPKGRANVWIEEEIQQWMNDRKASRATQKGKF